MQNAKSGEKRTFQFGVQSIRVDTEAMKTRGSSDPIYRIGLQGDAFDMFEKQPNALGFREDTGEPIRTVTMTHKQLEILLQDLGIGSAEVLFRSANLRKDCLVQAQAQFRAVGDEYEVDGTTFRYGIDPETEEPYPYMSDRWVIYGVTLEPGADTTNYILQLAAEADKESFARGEKLNKDKVMSVSDMIRAERAKAANKAQAVVAEVETEAEAEAEATADNAPAPVGKTKIK